MIDILYEDEELLVCVKPSGLLSVADASQKPSVQGELSPRTLFPIHRLDKETVGLLVFAKTAQCAAFLNAHLEDFSKDYLALCEGTPPMEGELTDLLFYDRTKSKTFVVKKQRNGVKEARLSYRVLQTGDRSLLEVHLFTGRTHQIRVQFASRSYPLVGDRRYGAKEGGALQLYAYRLSFPHPNGQRLSFSLPADFCPFLTCKSEENTI